MDQAQHVVKRESDADEALARRIHLIHKHLGGLGEFFEKIRRERAELNSDLNRGRFGTAVEENRMADQKRGRDS